MKKTLILFFLSHLTSVIAMNYDVKYFVKIFGHIHGQPYQLSESETAISCGFPLKVFKEQNHKYKDWFYVQSGDKKGYVLKKFVSVERPKCFQKKYNEFYNGLDLNLSDLYYWARLYDQFAIIETRP